MILTLSFLVVSLLFWGFFHWILGGPWVLQRPASFEAVELYKRVEVLIYLASAFGIPLLSAGLATGIEKKRGMTEVPPKRLDRAKGFLWFWWGVIPLLLFLYLPRPNPQAPISHMDEGLRVGAAQQTLQGKQPYREVYLLYGPGIEVWQPRLAFRLFGTTLAAQRALEWIIEPLGIIAMVALATAVFSTRWAVLFLLLVIGARIPPVWVTPRATLTLLSLLAMLWAWRDKRKRDVRLWAFASGLLTFAAFLYSKEAGFVPPLAIGSALMLRAWHQGRQGETPHKEIESGIGYLVGLLSLGLPWLLYLGMIGGLEEFFRNSFLVSSSVLSAWGKPSPPFTETLLQFFKNPFSLFAYTSAAHRWWFPVFLSMAVLARSLQVLGRKESAEWEEAPLLLALTGLFSFLIAMGRSDYDHWLKATSVYWVLLVYLIERWLRQAKGMTWIPRALRFLVALVLIKVTWSFGSLSDLWHKIEQRPPWPKPALRLEPPTLSRLGNLTLTPEELVTTGAVVERLKHYAKAQGKVWILGDEATYYFLADVVNPTRYANVSFVFAESMIQEVLGDLEREKPDCIMGRLSGETMEVSPQHQQLTDWVQKNYRVAEIAAGHLFWVPIGPS